MSSHPNIETGIEHRDESVRPAVFTHGFVNAGGLRLHYLDYGTADRPAMVCLHGGAAHAHWFDFVAGIFSRDYHVLALDQRGHGDSAWAQPPVYSYERYASDLAEVVEKFHLRDFVLIGHSMGGMVSLVYAATHPGRVAKLVIVDTTMNLTAERLAAMHKVGNHQGRSYATLEEFAARFRLRPPGTTAAPDIVRHLAEYSAHRLDDGSWRHKFDRNVYLMRESKDGMPYWNQVRIPTLLVKGELSERITAQVFAEVTMRCPHVAFAEVAESNHHITLDNPAGFVQAVKPFLDER